MVNGQWQYILRKKKRLFIYNVSYLKVVLFHMTIPFQEDKFTFYF